MCVASRTHKNGYCSSSIQTLACDNGPWRKKFDLKCQITKKQQNTTLLQHGLLRTVLHISGILQYSIGLYLEISVIQTFLSISCYRI